MAVDSELLKVRVSEANGRLKAAGVPVRLKLKGGNIAIVATLPKKPEHGTGRKQYDISLGIPATKTGVARAEREAHKLGLHGQRVVHLGHVHRGS